MVDLEKRKKDVLDGLYKNGLISLPHFRAGKKLRCMHFVFLKKIEAPKALGSSLRRTYTEHPKYPSNVIPDDSVCYETLWKYLYAMFQQCVQDTRLLKQSMLSLLWDEPIQTEREKTMVECIQSILEETRRGIKKYKKLCLKKARAPCIFVFC